MAYPSPRSSPVGRLREISIPVNWMTVLVGFAVPPEPGMPLTSEDVINFAIDQMAAGVEPSDEMLAVAGASSMDTELIGAALRRLAAGVTTASAVEQRKWRLLAVCDLVDSLPADPLYALLALTEFWAAMGFPPDMPHTVQGRGNTLSPVEYYTDANRDREVEGHRSWIASEIEELRSRSGSTDERPNI